DRRAARGRRARHPSSDSRGGRGDLEKFVQVAQGPPSGLNGVVAVPAQLDVYPALVTDLAQRRQYRAEVDLALAEHQMLVDAAAHVLDVDIPQPVLPPPQVV